jgi:hypothetical protein
LAVRCSGITRSGTRCERSADGPNGLCWAHNPANAEARRRLASRAGKAKPGRELANIKDRLQELAEDVLTGEVDKGAAAVAGQLLNTVIRAVSVELKAREQLELIERLEALEGALERQKESHRYGA